jgi:lauroyl/myristoyl acyltransferase
MRRAWRKIRYRLEWLGLKSATKFVPLLSRRACYRLALLLGWLGASLDRRGRRVAIVTSGLGWAQREGGAIEEIRPGDVV